MVGGVGGEGGGHGEGGLAHFKIQANESLRWISRRTHFELEPTIPVLSQSSQSSQSWMKLESAGPSCRLSPCSFSPCSPL